MRTKIAGLALACGLSMAGMAQAGIYTDDLSRCLVRSATADDQKMLMGWIFAMFTSSPTVAAMSKVTPAEREASDRRTADLMQRLIYTDCHKETVDALKYEGSAAFEASFSMLGQVAVRALFSDPATRTELQKFGTYFDQQKQKALFAEAGLPPASEK